MARLDRTVRTLRWHMFLIWLYKGGELTNWYKLFSLAVRHFNTVPHQFSPIHKPEQRYKYRTFEKGANRHLFRAEQRRVRYVVGNKFILDGDAVVNTANDVQHSITQGLYEP